jgi:hypothetical protein
VLPLEDINARHMLKDAVELMRSLDATFDAAQHASSLDVSFAVSALPVPDCSACDACLESAAKSDCGVHTILCRRQLAV